MRNGKNVMRDVSNAKKKCYTKDEERKLRTLVEARLPATGTALPPTLSPSLPASPSSPYLSLNCLIMLEIFSKRCTSVWAVWVAWEMTKKVAFSKSTI